MFIYTCIPNVERLSTYILSTILSDVLFCWIYCVCVSNLDPSYVHKVPHLTGVTLTVALKSAEDLSFSLASFMVETSDAGKSVHVFQESITDEYAFFHKMNNFPMSFQWAFNGNPWRWQMLSIS